MAKSKYDPLTFPAKAEDLARRGANKMQIAYQLGISHETMNQYEKRYPEFTEAIKRGNSKPDVEVQNSLLEQAKGFVYPEETVERQINSVFIHYKLKNCTIIDEDGKQVDLELINDEGKPVQIGHQISAKVKVTKKHVQSVTATIFWLCNRLPEFWKHINKLIHEYAEREGMGDLGKLDYKDLKALVAKDEKKIAEWFVRQEELEERAN